jgi:type II secretory pathway pseudopilin PulG
VVLEAVVVITVVAAVGVAAGPAFARRFHVWRQRRKYGAGY